MDTLQVIIENLSDLKPSKESKEFLDYLFQWGPLLIGALGMYISYLQFKKSLETSKEQFKESFKNSVLEKSMEDERKEIYKKLNEFYGPLLQLREKSSRIYDRFRKEYYKIDKNFRTLDYILNGHEFKESEFALLKEIIEIGKECEALVQTKAGLVDEPNLRYEILPKFTTHLLILRLAFEDKLKGNPKEFEMHRFPRNIDEELKNQINRLQSRLDELNKGQV